LEIEMSNALAIERLKELLTYHPETGIFTWNRTLRGGGARLGQAAGHVSRFGYIVICIDGKKYYAHRLAIFYMTGAEPMHAVDHMDGNRSNNRIENLRDVTLQVNQQNRRRACNRSTGRSSQFLGVSWKKEHRKWGAHIAGPDGRQKFLGYFDTELAAHESYVKAKRELHEGNTL
jgi:hypothetical protein